MKRRDFLRKTSMGAGIAAVPAVAVASVDRFRQASEPARDELKRRVDVLEKKFENLNGSQKKTMKLLVVLTGVSIGLDLSLLV